MKGYRWVAAGDVSAFFGLMLDNLADMVLFVSLLASAYQFDANFAISYMIPGTALGVLVGDLCFTWMAFSLAKRTGRTDVTAMPLGLDTPSTFGMVFFVVGPAYLDAKNAQLVTHDACLRAWQVGVCAIMVSGVIKLACAMASGWVRRNIPRAGLLGSLAAIALVLISFLPLLDLAAQPVVGFTALAVILTTLVARVPLPWNIPGALGALVVGTAVHLAMNAAGLTPTAHGPSFDAHLGLTLPVISLGWLDSFQYSLQYLPVVIPFALATVVGGIDCTESAAAVGDEYDTGQVVAVEALATLVAGLCGGVIQTTPYIGHPAYKAMGGRAAYTLATALFIGGAGVFGYFAPLYAWLPREALLPILIFVGLEITSQSFHATPRQHYPAVVLACVPAMAYLVMIFADNLLGQADRSLDQLGPPLGTQLQALRALSGGFIITSMLWAAMLAALIDRRLYRAAALCTIAAACSLFGVIHSPLPGSPLVVPWRLPQLPNVAVGQTPHDFAVAYVAMAALLTAWAFWLGKRDGHGHSGHS